MITQANQRNLDTNTGKSVKSEKSVVRNKFEVGDLRFKIYDYSGKSEKYGVFFEMSDIFRTKGDSL